MARPSTRCGGWGLPRPALGRSSDVNGLEAVLRRAATDLDTAKARWAVVDALAVSVWTEPRFTRDIDLAVATADDRTAEDLVHRLTGLGYEIVASAEQEATGRLATVRLRSRTEPEEAPVLDLLFASSGIESEIARAAVVVEVLPGLRLPVARAGHLVALKLLSQADARPQDAVDLRALQPQLEGDEATRAREAVRLIAERGYDRGRDLAADLARLVGRPFGPA